MNGPLRAAVEAQITALTKNDRPERASAFASSVRQSARSWEERLNDPRQAQDARWQLLDAYVSRIAAAEDPSEIIFAEKMDFARTYLERLLREDGELYASQCHIRLRAVAQLLGVQRAVDMREAARAQEAA